MDKEDIKSQLEKARLAESFPVINAANSAMGEVVAIQTGAKMEARESVPLTITPESQKKAEKQIRAGIKGTVEKQIGGMIGNRQAERIQVMDAIEQGRMANMGEGMVRDQRPTESDTEEVRNQRSDESETEEGRIEEPSMRELQAQVPRRVGPQGEGVQRPRLAQGRKPSATVVTPTEGMAKAAFKTMALPLGSGVAGGILAYWLT